MHSLCLASSAPKYVCNAPHTADLISYPALIRAGYLERRQRRERSFFQSEASVRPRHSLYCSGQPVESLAGGWSLWVQGKVKGHVDSQASLIRLRENKPNHFVNLQTYTVSSHTATHCREVGFFFFHEVEYREEPSRGNISFEFACVALPTHVEDAQTLISHTLLLLFSILLDEKKNNK